MRVDRALATLKTLAWAGLASVLLKRDFVHHASQRIQTTASL